MNAELLRSTQVLQESRTGFYIHGRKGELWCLRVLPPPVPGGQEYVAFTTSYIVLHPKVTEWREYFRRSIPDPATIDQYEPYMKYGPNAAILERLRVRALRESPN